MENFIEKRKAILCCDCRIERVCPYSLNAMQFDVARKRGICERNRICDAKNAEKEQAD